MTTLRPIAVLALVAACSCAGCGGGGDGTTTEATATQAPATTVTTPSRVTHAAPELEALLPDRVGGLKLEKGSATGAAVFGGDAFSRVMTERLAAAGKAPAELRFANAQNTNAQFEMGVFRVPGMSAAALRDAIVASSRPNAPGLLVDHATLGGKPVTTLVYPGGSVLYLYDNGAHVFYIGTQNQALAAKAIALVP